jgi:hypothetical protein
VYKIVFVKLEGKMSLERSRRRLKNNIKMDFKEIEWESMDHIYLAQYRRAFTNTVMNFWCRKRQEFFWLAELLNF